MNDSRVPQQPALAWEVRLSVLLAGPPLPSWPQVEEGRSLLSVCFFFNSSPFSEKKIFSGIAYWWPIFVDQKWIVGKRPILVVCITEFASSGVHEDGPSWFLTVAVGSGVGPSQFHSFAFQTCLSGTEVKGLAETGAPGIGSAVKICMNARSPF